MPVGERHSDFAEWSTFAAVSRFYENCVAGGVPRRMSRSPWNFAVAVR